MAVTMKDVALCAGVSIRTVSRAINNLEGISIETRQEILAVASELGYRPSMLARALVTQHSRTLGLVIPHITNPYFAAVAHGVFETAREKDYSVLLNQCNWFRSNEYDGWQTVTDHAVEGMITDLQYGHEESILQFSKSFKPIVVLMKKIVSAGISAILVDIQKGGELAVEHLVQKGHRHIAMLATRVSNPENVERISAYKKVMGDHQLPHLIQFLGPDSTEPDAQGGCQAALQLFADHPQVTAIFAYNDLMAMGAFQACKVTGRKVPDDCAIIGFDDIAFAPYLTPALSTVRINKFEIGRQAVLRLLDMIEQPDRLFDPVMLNCELVIRESA